jgi:hypothetical protein
MNPKLPSVAVRLAIVAGLLFPAPVRAMDPVTCYLVKLTAEFLAGKAIEGIWDSATGKPDVRELDRRLKELEEKAAMRDEMREAIRKLRGDLKERVTRDEFRKMTDHLLSELVQIKSRIDDVEERLEKLEVQQEDLEKRTTNAGKTDYFVTRGQGFAKDRKPYWAVANYDLAVRLNPASAAAFLGRGRVYHDMGAHDVGIIDCTEAIRLDPKLAAAHVARAEAHLGRTVAPPWRTPASGSRPGARSACVPATLSAAGWRRVRRPVTA